MFVIQTLNQQKKYKYAFIFIESTSQIKLHFLSKMIDYVHISFEVLNTDSEQLNVSFKVVILNIFACTSLFV